MVTGPPTEIASAGSWRIGAFLLAAALACWPVPARARLRALRGADSISPVRVAWLTSWLLVEPRRVVVVLVGSVLAGGMLAGIGGAAGCLIITGVAYRRWWSGQQRRRHSDELSALLDAVSVMVAELRAGAHPASAALVASVGERAVHRVLASVAAGARLGGDVPALLERYAARNPMVAGELRRLAGAWALAERHGAGLAELLDAVRADLDARLRLHGQLSAQLAGPKASAAVLAGLPLLGIALGQGIGANPWRVLTGTPVGQALLVIGAGLVAAGVGWSARITERVIG